MRLYQDVGPFSIGGSNTNGAGRQFFQRAGTIDIGAGNPQQGLVEATLNDVELIEVTIDQNSLSTAVEGGACIRIADGTYATPPCGNGQIEASELCDGEILQGSTCQTFGYSGGELGCSASCIFEQAGCVFTPNGYENSFESSSVPQEFSLSGDAPWSVASDHAQHGIQSLQSDGVGDNETAEVALTLTFTGGGSIRFYARTSTEQNFDYLVFYVDGQQEGRWSGDMVEWQEILVPLEAGEHNFRWTYEKDEDSTAGQDTVWIDNIETINGTF